MRRRDDAPTLIARRRAGRISKTYFAGPVNNLNGARLVASVGAVRVRTLAAFLWRGALRSVG